MREVRELICSKLTGKGKQVAATTSTLQQTIRVPERKMTSEVI